MTEASGILAHLVRRDPACRVVEDVHAWIGVHRDLGAPWETTVDRAIATGCAADRLGFAFASGYHEALRALVPALGDRAASLCATEDGGAPPRAIGTRVEGVPPTLAMSGTKRWSTMSPAAEVLLIVASEGLDDLGRNRLALWRIPANRAGVTIEPMDVTSFAPEIPHATVRLDRVAVSESERMPGDGYARYLKPFRTIEDLHVHAAFLGWLATVARVNSWPRGVGAEVLMLLAALRGLADQPRADAGTHLALGGVIERSRAMIAACEPLWVHVDSEFRVRWERDRALLGVASSAREKRFDSAWRVVRGA